MSKLEIPGTFEDPEDPFCLVCSRQLGSKQAGGAKKGGQHCFAFMYVMYVPMCRIPEEECLGVQTQTLKPYQKQCGGNFLNSIIIIIWSCFLSSLSLSLSLALFLAED